MRNKVMATVISDEGKLLPVIQQSHNLNTTFTVKLHHNLTFNLTPSTINNEGFEDGLYNHLKKNNKKYKCQYIYKLNKIILVQLNFRVLECHHCWGFIHRWTQLHIIIPSTDNHTFSECVWCKKAGIRCFGQRPGLLFLLNTMLTPAWKSNSVECLNHTET